MTTRTPHPSATPTTSTSTAIGWTRRHLLAAVAAGPALALVLAACGDRTKDDPTADTTGGTTETTTGGTTAPVATVPAGDIGYPTDADTAVIRVGYRNGFVAQGTAFVDLPTVLVAGDGTVYSPAPVPAIYPGPLVSPLEVRTITPAGIAELLRLADEAGLLGPIPDYTAELNIADAPDTVVRITTDAGTFEHSAYALGMTIDSAGNPTDESTPARRALAAFVAQLTGLEATVGADALGTSSIFEPTTYRLQSSVIDEASLSGYDVEPTLVDWPSATGLALADAATCATLTAEASGGVFDDATSLTFFRDGGVLYSLAVAAGLPGDAACAPTP